MALTLEDAVRRRQLEEALSYLDTGAAPLDTPDTTVSDYPAAEAEAPVSKKEEKKAYDYRTWNTATDEQVIPDTATDEQVTPVSRKSINPLDAVGQVWDWAQGKPIQEDIVYPTEQRFWDQGPDKKLETQTAETVVPVPYGEAAPTPPPVSPYRTLDTGKGAAPEDYPQVAQDQGAGEASGQQAPDALTQVERGELWRLPWHPSKKPGTTGLAVADPDPENPDFKTPLNADEETRFRKWVKENKVPFDDSAKSDYDMRGFWKAAQEGDPDASMAVSKFDSRLHFSDKFKTPFHRTFSNESQYATSDAPHWEGDKLIDNQGKVVADETPKKTPEVPSAYPAQIVTPDEAAGKTSVVNAPSVQPAAKPSVAAAPSDDWTSWWNKTNGSPAAKEANPAEISTVNPDGTQMPGYISAVGGKDPVAIIIHHTGDHHTAAQTKAVLDQRGLGVELTVDRQGNVVQIGNAGAANIKTGWGPKGTGLNNSNIVGIEVAANDDGDVLPIQVQAVKNYLAKYYPNTQIYGHGEVNPGHKEADEGMTIVNAIRNERSGKGGDVATNVGDTGTVLQNLSDSGLNATHFGYRGDPNLDPASGRGEGSHVKDMVSGYDVALNRAAWEKVGRPEPGAEFSFAGRTWRFGDTVPELYKDARFDIFDKGNTIFSGGQLGRPASAPGGEQPGTLWDSWNKASQPDLQAAREETAKNQAFTDSLIKKYEKYDNLGSVYRDVDTNADIPENLRNLFKEKIHDRMIDQMIEYDPDLTELAKKDPEKAKLLAWAKWHNPQGEIVDTSAGSMNPNQTGGINADSLKDLWSKIRGMDQQFQLVAKPDPVTSAEDILTRFYKYTGADTEEKQQKLLDQIHNLPKEQQARAIDNLLPKDPSNTMIPVNPDIPNAVEIDDAINNLRTPGWVDKQNLLRQKTIQEAARKIAGDPRMRSTFGGGTSETIAATINGIEVAASAPGGLGFVMQAADAERTRIKAEHPDWTPEQIDREAVKGSLINGFGPVVGMEIFGVLAAPLLKGIGNPVLRRLAGALSSATGGGVVGAGASVATGGTPEEIKKAGAQGFGMGLIGGAMHQPAGHEPVEARPTAREAGDRIPAERQLEHTPVISPDFEVLPREESAGGDRSLKQGRIVEHVPDEEVLQDNYTGPKSSRYDDHDGNIAEVNGRNEQIADRRPLALGDRRVSAPGDTESKPPPLVREPEEAGAAQPPGGAGDRGAAPPQPDIFRPPRRAATTPDEALAQVKGYHDEHLKLVQAMGWEHDPSQQPMAHVRDDDRTIFIGGAPEHYIEQAKAHGIKDPAAQVEFARRGMDEEITHGLDFHAMRDDYDAKRAAGALPNDPNFHVWASNEGARAMRELFVAHDQAVAAKDHRLAKMIRDAFDYSNKAYHHGALNWGELKKPNSTSKMDPIVLRDHLFRARMELARQMDQASRRGEITEGSTMFRKVARGLSEWIKKIVGHFKRTHAAALQGKLGPRFQQHLQGIINKRRSLDAMAHGAKPPHETRGAFDRPSEHTPPPAEIQKPTYVPKNWREKLAYHAQMLAARAGTAHSAWIKSGESFGLDHPTTEKLGQELRNQPVYRQKIFQVAKIAELSRAFKDVGWHQRASVSKEFSDWFDARERGNPLPALSPKAKRLVDATNVVLDRLGQIATNMGIKVKDDHGNVHPFTVIKNYFPRILSKHTEDVFEHRDGIHKAEFDQLYADAVRKGVAKTRDEFIQKFERATVPDVTSNAFFGNAEHTRTMHLPLDMHDRSPDAVLRYVTRMTDRLSDIKAFGQKFDPSTKDLFDHTNDAVAADPTLTTGQKQMMGARVNQERNAAYARHFVDNFSGISGKGRSLAASIALGNWFSSANNLIGGAGSNVSYGGPLSAGKAYLKYLARAIPMIKDTEDRGILTSNMRDMMGDFAKAGDVGWMTRMRQGYNRNMMEWGGQNATETLNRTVAAQQAKYLLQKFQKWGAPGADKGVMGARVRDRIGFFKRRGFTDNELDALWREGGDPDKHYGDRFIKNYVLDSHGSYSPGQTAAHIFDSPVGKLLLQFQKFGANQWRMQSREFLVPMGKSFSELAKHPTSPEHQSDAGYQFARNIINFAVVLPATGLAANTLLGLVKNKKGEEASWAQLGKELRAGQYGRVAWHYFGKMMQAYTLAGMTGPVANYLGIGLSELGITRGRVKDPRNPALLSVMIQPMWDYLKGASEIAEGDPGKFPAAMADSHLLGKLFTQISGLRAMYQAAGGLEHRMGLDDPWIHAGRDVGNANNMSFLRSRVKTYEEAHPELRRTPSNAPAPAKNSFSPYREDLHNDLLSGDAKGALAKVQEYLTRFPPGEAMERLKKIQDSVTSSTPIKPGGSSKVETQLDFIRWLQETQSPEDAKAIFNLAQTYAKTAIATGILGDSTMAYMAKLDYNKLPPTPVVKPEVQAKREAGVNAYGQKLLDALAKKRAEMQLQHH